MNVFDSVMVIAGAVFGTVMIGVLDAALSTKVDSFDRPAKPKPTKVSAKTKHNDDGRPTVF